MYWYSVFLSLGEIGMPMVTRANENKVRKRCGRVWCQKIGLLGESNPALTYDPQRTGSYSRNINSTTKLRSHNMLDQI